MHFTRYAYMVIILFNTGLYRSEFSTIYFEKQVFRLSVLCIFFF